MQIAPQRLALKRRGEGTGGSLNKRKMSFCMCWWFVFFRGRERDSSGFEVDGSWFIGRKLAGTEREAEGTECEPLVEVDLQATERQLLPPRQRPKGPTRTSRGETCGEPPRSSLGVKVGPLFMRKGVRSRCRAQRNRKL